MDIKMVGIDHSKADITCRERFAFTKSAAIAGIGRVTAEYGATGCVILSTCNRTELWTSDAGDRDPGDILCALKGVDRQGYAPYFTIREGETALVHLFETACGIRSRLFGEDQIITQVKDAVQLARDCGGAGTVLDTLFRTAVTAAKRVKTEVRLTAVNRSAAESAALRLLDHFASLEGLHCLVIGNGEIGRLAARALLDRGCDVRMTLRQYHTGEVTIPAGVRIVPYEERMEAVETADAVISATTSPHYTIRAEDLISLSPRPRVLIDLAVPRDIEPEAGEYDWATLYDIDELEDAHLDETTNEALPHARDILEEYEREFRDWYDFRDLVPAIQRTSRTAAEDVEGRIDRLVRRLPMEAEEQARLRVEVRQASAKVVQKLLFGLRENLDKALWADCVAALERAASGNKKSWQ